MYLFPSSQSMSVPYNKMIPVGHRLCEIVGGDQPSAFLQLTLSGLLLSDKIQFTVTSLLCVVYPSKLETRS